MKTALIAFALLLVACGGSSTKPDMTATPDLLPPPDFSLPPDMAQLTCKQMLACVTSCSGASFNTCIGACIAAGSTSALNFFTPLEDCAKPACYDADGGSDACATTGSGACKTCLTTSCSSTFSACEAN